MLSCGGGEEEDEEKEGNQQPNSIPILRQALFRKLCANMYIYIYVGHHGGIEWLTNYGLKILGLPGLLQYPIPNKPPQVPN